VELTNSYRILIRKIHGKRQIWKPEWRWGDNIKMDVME
jgi:hypothetical protein